MEWGAGKLVERAEDIQLHKYSGEVYLYTYSVTAECQTPTVYLSHEFVEEKIDI